MPVIKSAKKKLKQDRIREKVNAKKKDALKSLIKKARKAPSIAMLRDVSRAVDKAAKTHLIHKNRASRIKSSIAKLLPKKVGKTPAAPKKSASKS